MLLTKQKRLHKRLTFVHDGPIYYDENNTYYEYSYHDLLKRYSYLADDIRFLIRTAPISDLTGGDIVPPDITVIPCPDLNSPINMIKNKEKAKKIIRDTVIESDYLILRGGLISDLAYKYALKNNIPFIYECVGCTLDSLWNHSLLGKIVAPYYFLKRKNQIKNSKYVIYVTDKFLQRRYPTNGFSVSCSDVKIAGREEFNLKERIKRIDDMGKKRRLVLGTAAAIDVKYKGQQYVIKAIPELVKRGYNIEYHLCGGNRKNSNYLKNLTISLGLSERVKFLGNYSSDAMLKFYDSIDIYIQPSKLEGLPRSVIEAMSRGCPVLGSAVGGIPELIGDDFLFKKGSHKSIIQVFERMMQYDLKEISESNFLKSKKYTEEVTEAHRKKLYDKFIQEN